MFFVRKKLVEMDSKLNDLLNVVGLQKEEQNNFIEGISKDLQVYTNKLQELEEMIVLIEEENTARTKMLQQDINKLMEQTNVRYDHLTGILEVQKQEQNNLTECMDENSRKAADLIEKLGKQIQEVNETEQKGMHELEEKLLLVHELYQKEEQWLNNYINKLENQLVGIEDEIRLLLMNSVMNEIS